MWCDCGRGESLRGTGSAQRPRLSKYSGTRSSAEKAGPGPSSPFNSRKARRVRSPATRLCARRERCCCRRGVASWSRASCPRGSSQSSRSRRYPRMSGSWICGQVFRKACRQQQRLRTRKVAEGQQRLPLISRSRSRSLSQRMLTLGWTMRLRCRRHSRLRPHRRSRKRQPQPNRARRPDRNSYIQASHLCGRGNADMYACITLCMC